jgi:type II secretory pathway predicted ATPase ExeA
MRHWGLARDPFASHDSPYVALPAHDQALACLVRAIETARPLAVLEAHAGLGKSAVLRQALRAAASPSRRVARLSCPGESTQLLSAIAERLGARAGREPDRRAAWSGIDRACRLAGLERRHIVLAIDDCNEGMPEDVRQDLAALARRGEIASAGVTVIQVGRREPLDSWDESGWNAVVIGLEGLTRSLSERFLTEKLSRAGTDARIFTPRAVTRIHGWSRGVPRGLEQLATLALEAGAFHGLDAIPDELVDKVAKSCGTIPSLALGWPQPVAG